MSSSSVSQLLKITAPRAEAKPSQLNSSQDRQFQNLLARASRIVEGKPKQETETPPIRQSDEPVADNPEQDTSPQYDEVVTTSDVSSDADSETLEVQEDNLSDVIELSEAAELLFSTQVVPEEILSIEVTKEPTIEVSVIDAPSIKNYANQNEPESQSSTEQFAKTLDVNLPVNQYGQFTEEETTTEADIVEPPKGADSSSQEASKLPASETIVDSDGELAGEDFSEQAAQANAVKKQTNSAGTRDVEQSKSVTQLPPTKAEGPVASEEETPEETNRREISSHEPKAARGRESTSVETDATVETVGAEENISAAKEAPPVPSSHGMSVVNSASGEATAASLHSSTGSTGEGSNINADLDPVPTVDRARFVQRVSRAFRTAHTEGGQIQLRLSPPELGSMRISITVHEGVVSAKVEVETAAARNVMLDNLPALRERLAEQDIRIEKFDVDVGRDGGQEPDNPGPNDRQARQSRADSTSSSREREPDHLETAPSPRHVNPIDSVADGRLDVRI